MRCAHRCLRGRGQLLWPGRAYVACTSCVRRTALVRADGPGKRNVLWGVHSTTTTGWGQEGTVIHLFHRLWIPRKRRNGAGFCTVSPTFPPDFVDKSSRFYGPECAGSGSGWAGGWLRGPVMRYTVSTNVYWHLSRVRGTRFGRVVWVARG